MKASPENDCVDLMLQTIFGYDAVRSYLANPVCDDLNIGLSKRGIKIVGQRTRLQPIVY